MKGKYDSMSSIQLEAVEGAWVQKHQGPYMRRNRDVQSDASPVAPSWLPLASCLIAKGQLK
jgi:hypothetical protein